MHNPREHLQCRRKGCTYTTNRAYNLERHERNHEKGKVLVSQCQPCPHCTYAAGSLHNLMRHINKKHAALSEETKQLPITSQKLEQQHEPPSTEIKSVPQAEPSPEQERPLHKPIEQATDSSLWFWSTPQQMEKNFLRRSGLHSECKIMEISIKLYKFYALARARGGALSVDKWDDVAAALGLPTGSGCQTRVKYMELLYEFEKKEDERLQECQNAKGVPYWWDDGDFITDNIASGDEQWENVNCPSPTVRNVIVKMIYEKYYTKHLSTCKPFQRFIVKDSWLRATMLNYQALRCEMHLMHYSVP